MYLLDTNVCIALLNGAPRVLARRLDEAVDAGRALFVSSISIFELEYGIAKGSAARALENRSRLANLRARRDLTFIDFGAEDAAQAGRVREHLRAAGKPIGPYDLLIAGQALARGLGVVTANRGEFGRVSGLPVEDWSAA